MFSPPPRHAYFHNIELNLRDGTKLELIKVAQPVSSDCPSSYTPRAVAYTAGRACHSTQARRYLSMRTTGRTGTSRSGKCTFAPTPRSSHRRYTFAATNTDNRLEFGASPATICACTYTHRALGVSRVEFTPPGREGSAEPQDLADLVPCRHVRTTLPPPKERRMQALQLLTLTISPREQVEAAYRREILWDHNCF